MKDKEYKYQFCSIYQKQFYDYVEFKRRTGHKFERTSIFHLRMFDQLLTERYHQQGELILNQELIEVFTACHDGESSKSQYIRMNFIHNFAVYLNQVGIKCYIFPKEFFVKIHSEFTPYIFSRQEILNLIEYLDDLKISKRNPKYHIIYPMLIRMLYGCGLRINEALKLRYAEVDLVNGIYTLQKTKNYSQRIVVMSESLRKYTLKYVKNMDFSDDYTGYFLPGPDNGHYNSTAVYVMLKKHMEAVGIKRNDGTPPRVHDVRHTFAVHALDHLVDTGIDIYTVLPALSVYLGHTSISSTEKYLRLTQDAHSRITVPMEELYVDLFPEVCDEEY